MILPLTKQMSVHCLLLRKSCVAGRRWKIFKMSFLRIFCFLAARQTCEADRYKILGRKDKNAFSVRTKLAMLLLLLLSLSQLLLLCCCMPSLVTKTSTNTKKLVSSNSSSSLMMIFYRILLFRPFYIRPVSLPN